jgi:hypothetical protein
LKETPGAGGRSVYHLRAHILHGDQTAKKRVPTRSLPTPKLLRCFQRLLHFLRESVDAHYFNLVIATEGATRRKTASILSFAYVKIFRDTSGRMRCASKLIFLLEVASDFNSLLIVQTIIKNDHLGDSAEEKGDVSAFSTQLQD